MFDNHWKTRVWKNGEPQKTHPGEKVKITGKI
jgi:hypothetical protein